MRQDALRELDSEKKKRSPRGCVEIPQLQERPGSPNEYRGLVGHHIKLGCEAGQGLHQSKSKIFWRVAQVLQYDEANGLVLLRSFSFYLLCRHAQHLPNQV